MLKDVLDRIQERLKEVGLSESAAARQAKLSPDAIRNIRRSVEAGKDGAGVSTRTLTALAPVLQTTVAWLSDGTRHDDAEPLETDIPIMGYIGAGAEIEPEFEQTPPDGLDQVTIPFPVPSDLIGFRVRGTSMLPVFRDGTVVLVYREQKRGLETFYGEEAAVRTSDGRRYIKTVMRGGENNTVTLTSWNADPIENQRLEWIGEIFAVLPASALRRVERQGGIQGQLRLKTA
jgi:phage repressor protein C with HTH and peptisase S24 domain